MRMRGAMRAQVSFLIQLYRQSPLAQDFCEPGAPSAAPASAQRELPVPRHAGKKPRRRIAKTLAAVLPPAARPRGDVSGVQGSLPPLRAPTELPPGGARDFRAPHVLIASPHGVTQPQPDEVRHFVDEYPRQLRARAIQDDPPLAQKRPGMHRPAPV